MIYDCSDDDLRNLFGVGKARACVGDCAACGCAGAGEDDEGARSSNHRFLALLQLLPLAGVEKWERKERRQKTEGRKRKSASGISDWGRDHRLFFVAAVNRGVVGVDGVERGSAVLLTTLWNEQVRWRSWLSLLPECT